MRRSKGYPSTVPGLQVLVLTASTSGEGYEMVLAHVNNDRTEADYRRSDLFERRRALMQQWADYLAATA